MGLSPSVAWFRLAEDAVTSKARRDWFSFWVGRLCQRMTSAHRDVEGRPGFTCSPAATAASEEVARRCLGFFPRMVTRCRFV